MTIEEMIAICRMTQPRPGVWIADPCCSTLRQVEGGYTFGSYLGGQRIPGTEVRSEKEAIHLLYCNALPRGVAMHCPCGQCPWSEHSN